MGSVDVSVSSPAEENLWEELNARKFFTVQKQLVLYLKLLFFPLCDCVSSSQEDFCTWQVLGVFSLEKRWLRGTLLLSTPERECSQFGFGLFSQVSSGRTRRNDLNWCQVGKFPICQGKFLH